MIRYPRLTEDYPPKYTSTPVLAGYQKTNIRQPGIKTSDTQQQPGLNLTDLVRTRPPGPPLLSHTDGRYPMTTTHNLRLPYVPQPMPTIETGTIPKTTYSQTNGQRQLFPQNSDLMQHQDDENSLEEIHLEDVGPDLTNQSAHNYLNFSGVPGFEEPVNTSIPNIVDPLSTTIYLRQTNVEGRSKLV